MKNYVMSGKLIPITASANVASGAIVVVGQMFGVATKAVTTGQEVEIHCGGVFDFAKANAAGTSIANGANAFWDTTNSLITVSTGTRVGVMVRASANTDIKARVRLNSSF